MWWWSSTRRWSRIGTKGTRKKTWPCICVTNMFSRDRTKVTHTLSKFWFPLSIICLRYFVTFLFLLFLFLLPSSLSPSIWFIFLCPACLSEDWTPQKHKKGDQAAIAEDKKKKKKKKGGKKEGGDGGSEGEKSTKKKKEKKVKKKKKSKAPVEKTDGGVSSDEEIQPQVPLPGQKTELWALVLVPGPWFWFLVLVLVLVPGSGPDLLNRSKLLVTAASLFNRSSPTHWICWVRCGSVTCSLLTIGLFKLFQIILMELAEMLSLLPSYN